MGFFAETLLLLGGLWWKNLCTVVNRNICFVCPPSAYVFFGVFNLKYRCCFSCLIWGIKFLLTIILNRDRPSVKRKLQVLKLSPTSSSWHSVFHDLCRNRYWNPRTTSKKCGGKVIEDYGGKQCKIGKSFGWPLLLNLGPVSDETGLKILFLCQPFTRQRSRGALFARVNTAEMAADDHAHRCLPVLDWILEKGHLFFKLSRP